MSCQGGCGSQGLLVVACMSQFRYAARTRLGLRLETAQARHWKKSVYSYSWDC
jgi:hypothetical protein